MNKSLTMLVAGTVVAGAASFGGSPVATAGFPGNSHGSVALTSVADLLPDQQGLYPSPEDLNPLKALLDEVLGIGQKTLPQLIVSPWTGASPTFGGMLSWLGLSTDDQLSAVFTHLGLHLVTINSILGVVGSSDTDTVDEVVQHLDHMFGGFGLVESLLSSLTSSVGDLTVAEVFSQMDLDSREPLDELLANLPFGPDPSDTVGDLSIGQLLDFALPTDQTVVPYPPGVEDTTTVGDYLIALGIGTLTIDQLLGVDPIAGLL